MGDGGSRRCNLPDCATCVLERERTRIPHQNVDLHRLSIRARIVGWLMWQWQVNGTDILLGLAFVVAVCFGMFIGLVMGGR